MANGSSALPSGRSRYEYRLVGVQHHLGHSIGRVNADRSKLRGAIYSDAVNQAVASSWLLND